MRIARALCSLALLLMLQAATTAHAQDLVRGRELYRSICATCHGINPVGGSPARVANNPQGLLVATQTIEQMRFLANALNAQDRIDVTAWIGSVVPTITPQSGWYWNPAQSGRGFFIELRDGFVFMAGFHYVAEGAATWFAAQGPLVNGRLTSPIYLFEGGPSLTGNYIAPRALASPGNITVDFLSATTARLSWLGESIALSRFPVAGSIPTLPPQPGAPESGWWWNASESGRGFAIEFQADQVFIASFMYEDDGPPTWYVAQGTMQSPTRFEGNWLAFVDGQTQGAPYRAPTRVQPDAGPLVLTFSDSRHAVLILPDGREVALVRFAF